MFYILKCPQNNTRKTGITRHLVRVFADVTASPHRQMDQRWNISCAVDKLNMCSEVACTSTISENGWAADKASAYRLLVTFAVRDELHLYMKRHYSISGNACLNAFVLCSVGRMQVFVACANTTAYVTTLYRLHVTFTFDDGHEEFEVEVFLYLCTRLRRTELLVQGKGYVAMAKSYSAGYPLFSLWTRLNCSPRPAISPCSIVLVFGEEGGGGKLLHYESFTYSDTSHVSSLWSASKFACRLSSQARRTETCDSSSWARSWLSWLQAPFCVSEHTLLSRNGFKGIKWRKAASEKLEVGWMKK